ncbi:TPA: sigma-70 family RNA polymerase sigma factor [Streptococcus agalactiae]
MRDFEELFDKVKPIVMKLRRNDFVQLWEYDDWIQEGRIVLFRLLEEHPYLLDNESKLFIYFKTKFSNYLNDVLRHQDCQKRQFNKMPYEEISEVSHYVKSKGLVLDDYIAYRDTLTKVEETLSDIDKEKFEKLISGERFAGKKQFIRDIQPFFNAFKAD